jgi:tRNA G18 (ribose-2'-O)-methylase SpoU
MEQLQPSNHNWRTNYHKLPLLVLLDNTQDRNNLGAILRVCDALCVEQLYWTGAAPITMTKKVRRVARGADSHVSQRYIEDLPNFIIALKSEGYTVFAVEITNDSQALTDIDFQSIDKIALVMGAEQRGISQAVLDVSDYAIHIPMFGVGFSMNVSCALSIALYEVIRQKLLHIVG